MKQILILVALLIVAFFVYRAIAKHPEISYWSNLHAGDTVFIKPKPGGYRSMEEAVDSGRVDTDSTSWASIHIAIGRIMSQHYCCGADPADPADHWAPTKEEWLRSLPNATMQGDTIYSRPFRKRMPVMVVCKDGTIIWYTYFQNGFRSAN